ETILVGNLQVVSVAAFNLVDALKFDLRTISSVIDQQSIQIRLGRSSLQLIGSEVLDFVPVEKRTQLPTLRAVVHLNRSLAVELNFQSHLAPARQVHHKWQLCLLLGSLGQINRGLFLTRNLQG